jgi:hypothetical protein
VLTMYQRHYNKARTHLSLNKYAPVPPQSRLLAASSPSHSSEACTINTFGFDFR